MCARDLDDLDSQNLCAVTDEQGKYTINNLAEGFYVLEILPLPPYAVEWLDGATRIGAAKVIHVIGAKDNPIGDTHVPLGGTIEGTVSDASSKARHQGSVRLRLDGPGDFDVFPCVESNAAGEYKFEGLVAGSYAVSAEDRAGCGRSG